MIQFSVQKSVLATQLSRLYPFAGKHPMNAIWEFFKFKLIGGELMITVVDYIHFATVKVPVNSTDQGLFCLPITMLKQTLPELEEEVIHFAIDHDKSTCVLSTSSGRYKFSSEAVSNFPVKATAISPRILEFSGTEFLENVAQLAPISAADLHNGMSCVFIEGSPEGLSIVATDGFRLATIQTPFPLESTFLLSRKSAVQAKNFFDKANASNIQYELEEKWLKISSANSELSVKLMEEEYPKYRNVIPAQGPNKLFVKRTELLFALKRSAAINGTGVAATSALMLNKQEVKITAQNMIGDSFQEEKLTAFYQGESVIIGINPHLLMPMLSLITDEELTFHIISENKPILITGEMTANRTLLIMPVRIETPVVA